MLMSTWCCLLLSRRYILCGFMAGPYFFPLLHYKVKRVASLPKIDILEEKVVS